MLGSAITSTINNAASDAATGLAIASIAGGPIGAIAGGITFAAQTIASLIDSNGPKKLAATQIANNAMYAAQVNLSEWNNYPVSMKTKALQVQYLNQFQQIWGYLTENCSNPSLGSAGQRCISERDHNGIYDYWTTFYDPILNDPQVYDPSLISSVTSLATGSQTIAPTTVVNSATGSSLLTLVESNPTIDLAILAGLVLIAII